MVQEITRDHARRFLLRHQMLLPPQSLSGMAGVERVFQHLRLVQYDPLNPCGRNIDLVMQSRVAEYHPDDYLLWQRGKGMEGFDKVLCVVPREDWAYLHFGVSQLPGERGRFLREHRTELDALIERIRSEGPLRTVDVKDERKLPIGWRENHWGKVALETLARVGELVVVKREGGKKYYDLPERLLGNMNGVTMPTLADHIKRRIGAVGMLPASGAGMGWLGAGRARELSAEMKRMVADGELIEVRVEGVKTVYVMRASDRHTLEEAKLLKVKLTMSFLAPLDNMLWDRHMVRDLFHFDYLWEVYVPAAKRKHGYYVLPVLYDDELIGRIEPVVEGGKLVIKGWWMEGGVKWDRTMQQALMEAVERFREYTGAGEVEFRCGINIRWK